MQPRPRKLPCRAAAFFIDAKRDEFIGRKSPQRPCKPIIARFCLHAFSWHSLRWLGSVWHPEAKIVHLFSSHLRCDSARYSFATVRSWRDLSFVPDHLTLAGFTEFASMLVHLSYSPRTCLAIPDAYVSAHLVIKTATNQSFAASVTSLTRLRASLLTFLSSIC